MLVNEWIVVNWTYRKGYFTVFLSMTTILFFRMFFKFISTLIQCVCYHYSTRMNCDRTKKWLRKQTSQQNPALVTRGFQQHLNPFIIMLAVVFGEGLPDNWKLMAATLYFFYIYIFYIATLFIFIGLLVTFVTEMWIWRKQELSWQVKEEELPELEFIEDNEVGPNLQVGPSNALHVHNAAAFIPCLCKTLTPSV